MSEQRECLAGKAAVRLWKKGREAWNAWAAAHPNADVWFSRMDFSSYGDISFKGFNFPDGEIFFIGVCFGEGNIDFGSVNFGKSYVNFDGVSFGGGYVNFSSAKFGGANVNFHGAKFGEGSVNFSGANFGKGRIDFSWASFSNGIIDFSRAMFGGGKISFYEANFGNGKINFSCDFGDSDVNFSYASFGDGNIDFCPANFGNGYVDFSYANFGKGAIVFNGTHFGKGNVNFHCVNFGEGTVDFTSTDFDNGNTDFSFANFGTGDVRFDHAKFGDGDINFKYAKIGRRFLFSDCTLQTGEYDFSHMRFGGHARFDKLKNTEHLKKLSFQNSSFDQSTHLSGRFPCVPDFRGTKTGHHMDISNLYCDPSRGKVRARTPSSLRGKEASRWGRRAWVLMRSFGFRPRLASDKEDASRLRRLKEIAESNRHHAAALRFHADEMRAMRWREMGFGASLLDRIYDLCSDYGQSLWRPLRGWLGTLTFFFMLYGILSFVPSIQSEHPPSAWSRLGQAASVSLGNTVPFIPTARSMREDGLGALFGKDPGFLVDLLTLAQGALSFIFLFLTGLALRNRFRI